jgi:hypothetical protein
MGNDGVAMITKDSSGDVVVPLEDLRMLRASGILDPVGFIDRMLCLAGLRDESDFDRHLAYVNEQLGL